jgi:chromosome partitioning protein
VSAKTPILIAAMNRKGGIGKTTLVRALTSAIVHAGKSVLLIDTDGSVAQIA